MNTADDRRFMTLALQLAEGGRYTARPNPCVGCLIVNDGVIVGRGYHRRTGEGHAEVLALAEAGSRAAGATVYLTLEPCAHHGRTPPCCDALVTAGVSRVVVAMVDPNPRVAGRGLKYLSAAGVQVTTGLLEAQAQALNPGFVKRMQSGRPWVRCKLAMSLDGRTAMASGESRWITGRDARRDVQRLRARSGAIITGSGTVLADNPAMRVRYEMFTEKMAVEEMPEAPYRLQPLRVVVDALLQTDPAAVIYRDPGECFVACAEPPPAHTAAFRKAGIRLQYLPGQQGRVDLDGLLAQLAREGCNEVLVEAGPGLAGGFLAAGLVDELWVYLAPRLMGHDAMPLVALPALQAMADNLRLTWQDIRQVGNDLRLICRPEPSGPTDSSDSFSGAPAVVFRHAED